MKYFIQILVFLLVFNKLYGQKNNHYLFSSEINFKMKNDTTAHNYQSYAVKYANIGDYKNTLLAEELFVANSKKLKHGQESIDTMFYSYYPENAIKEIIKKSQKHQIVIINEAHYSAQNRVFASIILDQLFDQGYKTLFVEDLSNFSYSDYDKRIIKRDEQLNERKYPLLSSGQYIKEPQYANMLRKALKLGYNVLPYEHIPDDSIKDPIQQWSLREKGQANNILDFLKKNPKEKIIIYCGYGHLNEKLYEGDLGMMSAILKKKSGLDPFTICQTKWLETFSDKTANLYRKLIDSNPPKEISIFKNLNGDYFSPNKEEYDVQVYFPKTKYIKGRPDWLMATGERKYVSIPFSKIELEFPYLVKAFYDNETETNAIAADIIELTSNKDMKALILEKGNYSLVIEDIKGNTQNLELIVD